MPKPLTVPAEATSGKRSATDGEPKGQKGTKTHQTAAWRVEGRRDDGEARARGRKGSAKDASKSSDAKLHNAILKTLCALSQQVREVRGAARDCSVYGALASTVGESTALVVSSAARVANFKQIWDDLEPERAIDLVPHCKLAKVYDPALCRLELAIRRTHSWGNRTNRSESSSRSSS